MKDYRAAIAAQERRLCALLQPTRPDYRPQVQAMARRVRAAWANEPAAAEALRLAGVEGLLTLLSMRNAAQHPAMQALRGAR